MALLPPLPKYQLSPLVVDLFIEVNYDSNSVNVRLWNTEKYAAITDELKRLKWKSLFEGQTIDQCYGTFLSVTNNVVELHVPLTSREENVVS